MPRDLPMPVFPLRAVPRIRTPTRVRAPGNRAGYRAVPWRGRTERGGDLSRSRALAIRLSAMRPVSICNWPDAIAVRMAATRSTSISLSPACNASNWREAGLKATWALDGPEAPAPCAGWPAASVRPVGAWGPIGREAGVVIFKRFSAGLGAGRRATWWPALVVVTAAGWRTLARIRGAHQRRALSQGHLYQAGAADDAADDLARAGAYLHRGARRSIGQGLSVAADHEAAAPRGDADLLPAGNGVGAAQRRDFHCLAGGNAVARPHAYG